MRRLLALVLLLALPASAWAATYYITPTSPYTLAEGLNPSTPTTMAVVNAGALNGDVVRAYHGVYPTVPNPAHGGVTYVGSIATPSAVSCPGKLTLSRDSTVVKGFTFTGGCEYAGGSDRDSVAWCSFNGTQELFIDRSEYNVFANNTFVGTQVRFGWTQLNDDPGGWPVTERVKYLKMLDNTLTLTLPSGTTEDAWRMRGAYQCEVARNVVSWSIPAICDGGTHGTMLYHALNNYFHDNYWLVKSNAPGRRYALHLRDSTRFNTFARDTIIEDLSGSGSLGLVWTGSGNNSTMLSLRSNTMRGCVVKVRSEGLSWSNYSRGDSIVGNVFISTGGNALACTQDVPPDSVVLEHNAFVSPTLNTFKGAARFEGLNYGVRGWSVRYNVFYNGRTSTSPPAYASVVYLGQDNNSTHALDDATTTDDYNLFWSGAGGSEPRQNQSIGYGALTLRTPAAFASSFGGRESHSVGASPSWVDSSFTITRGGTNGFALRAGSNALFGPDGYVGPYSVAAPDTCTDALRPGRVADLGILALTDDAITVRWTAPGSDQYANNDSRTLWELRAATAPITTESEWSAAALVATLELDTPGAIVTGGVSGLASGSTRYFAVRYTDGDGRRACISNAAGATVADVTAPAAIADLGVLATTATTATLRWTAPGDNGTTGTATSYRVRYRIGSPIASDADWTAATVVSGAPSPSVAGTVEGFTVTGLTSDRTYYFGVRAVDDGGNQGGLSNSPAGVTPDVTAPAAVSTLTAPSATTNSITLRWNAPGDDGAAGTAAQYDVRYVAGTAITNDAAFAAATPVAGEPAPQVAGTVQTVTVSGLGSGTTFSFAMKTMDEAGNWSALSNSVSRATILSDAVRPAAPAIIARAWPEKADGVQVIFSAPGDDSLTGTASSYELRYRTDPGVDLAHWNDLSAASQTFRVATPVPHVAGTPETLTVRGLRPGGVYWFAVRAVDDFANPSAVSVADSAAVPARNVPPLPIPLPALYAGAGFGENEPVIRPWSGLVGDDGAAVDTAACRVVARRAVVSLEPGFADSAGSFGRYVSLRAIQTLRAMNPAIVVLAEPTPDASYIRVGADTANVYAYRFQQWRAARDGGGGWAAGGGFLWDYISPTCFHQTRASGCVAGNTLLNTNLAWQPTPGAWPVADSLVAVYKRQFIERRHPDGTWVWDGVMTDLNSPDIFSEINVNWSRAGYADSLALDTAWVAAKHYFMAGLRKAAVDAGRPDFIISGNGVSGRAYDQANGWMREGWPDQQGGSWGTNWRWFPGGQAADFYGFSAWQPALSWVFAFACASGDSCTGYNPDSTGARKQARYATGTAALTGAAVVIEPSKAALAQGGGFENWWFDEWAADTVTAQAVRGPAGVGYLTVPATPVYQTVPTIWAGGDRLQAVGGFEFATLGTWWDWSIPGPSGQVTLALATDTVATGSKSLRVRVGTRQAADWGVSVYSKVSGYATSGQTLVLTFKARASSPRPIQAQVTNKSDAVRSSWSANSRTWIGTEWSTYRIVGTATATDSVRASFWLGDTTGTVWLDDVTLHVGGSRGGSFVREFRRGVVIVNPNTYADTVTFGRATRRLRALPDKNPDVNTGSLLAAGSAVIIPAQDARFLIFPLDSIRPNATADLAATATSSTSARLLWTAPGNDSLPCGGKGAARYEVRVAASAIASEGAWSAASVVAQSIVPGAACDPETLDVVGLTPSTTYYWAVRAYDEAGYFSAISNSDSSRTLSPGAPPTAAFTVTPGSGAEPLAIACADLSTNTPTSWEWYVRRDADGADPQISSDQNPTFTLEHGGTYRVTFQAVNAFGRDTAEALVDVVCTPPAAVATISATPATSSTVQVTYKETGDDGDTGAAGSFAMRYREGSTFAAGDWATATPVTGLPIPTGAGTTSGVLVAGLLESKTYAFAMKATDSGGCESALGAVAVCTTPSSESASGARVGVQAGSFRVRVKFGGYR